MDITSLEILEGLKVLSMFINKYKLDSEDHRVFQRAYDVACRELHIARFREVPPDGRK
jgi:hypothetical protein